MLFGKDVLYLQPALPWLHSCTVRENAFTGLAVMQMCESMSNSVVPVVPKGPPGQDLPYLNTELLSVKSHTINSSKAPQTAN